MTIPSSPLAARNFRVERVRPPAGETASAAGLRLRAALARGGPVDLEIGCGVGWHPIRYAAENPDRVLVAIERTAEKYAKFAARLAAHPEIPNLIPVHADAVAWVTHFAPPGAFARIFLLYPNPSRRNPAARWIRMPFFGHLLEKLRAGGEIHVRTNLAEYAAEVRARCGGWGLDVREERRFGVADLADARTHFERKYLARGEHCYSLSLARTTPGTLR